MVDMKKEIKLSDLFKRGSKESSDGENGKAPREAKAPKEPKPPKERGRWRGGKKEKPQGGALAAHEAPPPADVPLMRAFNLLPSEEVRAEREGGAQSPLPYVLVALVGVLLFAAIAAFYLMAGTEVTKKRGEVEDLRAELAAYQASAKQQTSVEDKSAALTAERLGRTNALSAALVKRLAWDRLLREIALVVPDEVSLAQIQGSSPTVVGETANADGSPVTNLTIIGTTLNESSVAEFMTRLSVIRELAAVQLKEAGDSPAGDNQVVFTITGTLRSGS
jgi:Tfp pilus assembly protein PilN